jgi:hypothetical protein
MWADAEKDFSRAKLLDPHDLGARQGLKDLSQPGQPQSSFGVSDTEF